MARPLPFRMRVPLAKILHAKQRPVPSEADTAAMMGAEELWDYSSKPDYLRMILTSKVYDVANETPLQPAARLSERIGNAVYLKREDLQPGFSFKVRGAYNKMAHMSRDDLQKGVLAHAVGGHAEGVAIAAHKLGVRATVVLPEITGAWKVRNLERLGADVVLHGRTHEAAIERCIQLAHQTEQPVIPSYDDPFVIAGQGTVGLEILRQLSERPPSAVFVCTGGGGLLAGVCAYVKAVTPGVKVVGVEAVNADAMTRSLRAGHRVRLERVDRFAEGAAVERVGEETFRVCDELVDDMVTVTPDEICAAVHDGFEDTRAILEPAGALAIAGLKKWAGQMGVQDEALVAITSGANCTFDRLRLVAERALYGQRAEALVATRMADEPGAMLRLYGALSQRNVTELVFRSSTNVSGGKATVFVGVELGIGDGGKADADDGRHKEMDEIIARLAAVGIQAHDMSDNDLAKSHLRYMTGGVKVSAGALGHSKPRGACGPQRGRCACGGEGQLQGPEEGPSGLCVKWGKGGGWDGAVVLARGTWSGWCTPDLNLVPPLAGPPNALRAGPLCPCPRSGPLSPVPDTSEKQPAEGEMLYRFEFPEQPGALKKFLEMFNRQPQWNLTLLHYRYRGSELSKVLTGIQIPPGDEAAFECFLKDLGYYYVNETSNLVYDFYCD